MIELIGFAQESRFYEKRVLRRGHAHIQSSHHGHAYAGFFIMGHGSRTLVDLTPRAIKGSLKGSCSFRVRTMVMLMLGYHRRAMPLSRVLLSGVMLSLMQYSHQRARFVQGSQPQTVSCMQGFSGFRCSRFAP
jgi:hypothetical protein